MLKLAQIRLFTIGGLMKQLLVILGVLFLLCSPCVLDAKEAKQSKGKPQGPSPSDSAYEHASDKAKFKRTEDGEEHKKSQGDNAQEGQEGERHQYQEQDRDRDESTHQKHKDDEAESDDAGQKKKMKKSGSGDENTRSSDSKKKNGDKEERPHEREQEVQY
jgi:hypothetical protein